MQHEAALGTKGLSIGFAAGVIADVLQEVYGWTATHIARFMYETLNYADDVIEGALGFAGFAANEIANAMDALWAWICSWAPWC